MENVYIDGKITDDTCPSGERCTCGCPEFELEYGFCPYGFGTFQYCVMCGTVYNFCEDKQVEGIPYDGVPVWDS